MGKKLHDNSLGLVAVLLFVIALVGQTLTGHSVYNDEQVEHGERPVGLVEYLRQGHFGEATFENWESEFLQMGVFIFLTALLVQRGSAESKKPEDEREPGEKDEREDDPALHRGDPDAPWPVRYGGWAAKVYSNSLSIAFLVLFLATFALHAVTGAREFSAEETAHGGQPVSALEYLGEPQFWFESFQNWQSEFLAVLAIVMLSIFLRQHGSPESKPVHAPHEQTGSE
ncbi:MAG TPA: DUF6766 family protein [Longimicrobium sp.]|nr:DUF6766 family protein [Longimicrobium sp.]